MYSQGWCSLKAERTPGLPWSPSETTCFLLLSSKQALLSFPPSFKWGAEGFIPGRPPLISRGRAQLWNEPCFPHLLGHGRHRLCSRCAWCCAGRHRPRLRAQGKARHFTSVTHTGLKVSEYRDLLKLLSWSVRQPEYGPAGHSFLSPPCTHTASSMWSSPP